MVMQALAPHHAFHAGPRTREARGSRHRRPARCLAATARHPAAENQMQEKRMTAAMLAKIDLPSDDAADALQPGDLDAPAAAPAAATATTLPLAWLRIDPTIRAAEPVASPPARRQVHRPFFTAPDSWRERAAVADDGHAARLAEAARQSSSPLAFRPALSPADWRLLASYCVATTLPADHRVLIPGSIDRTLRFVLEGSLLQVLPAPGGSRSSLLTPGCMVGEDTLFTDGPGQLDVRTREETLVLELRWPRRAELTAVHRGIAFELLRAAGAVVAARLAAV
jgi:CRP/FNR family cyclic AMP-dependent transcriptional regulator